MRLRKHLTAITALAIGVTSLSIDSASPVLAEDPVPDICAAGGPNVIIGTNGDDDIDGTNGDDVICGLGGNDKITGGNGDDVLIGGSGDDELDGGNGNDELVGGSGNDKIIDPNGNDTIDGGDGDDEIDDSNGDDTIDAGDGDNKVKSGNGDDTVSAGSGNDEIESGDGDDRVDAGDGENEIKSGNGDDLVTSGNGNDKIETDNGDDEVASAGGDDEIDTGNGNDRVNSGSGNDQVLTDNGRDYVDLGDGDDYAETDNGKDVVIGGDGDDEVDAGNGKDVCIDVEDRTKCEDTTGSRDGDGDGVSDFLEGRFNTDPRRRDTDGDGLTDLFEITWGGFIHEAGLADTDGDGTQDGQEDYDGDGLTALEEQAGNSDPLLADGDGDGLTDPDELAIGTDPLVADTDADGLVDAVELPLGFDPLDEDTDDDGILDGDETAVFSGGAPGVSVAVEGDASSIATLEVEPRDRDFTRSPAQVSDAFEIDLDDGADFSSADITFEFDPTVHEAGDLAVYWFDEDLGAWVPAQDPDLQVIDPVAGTVTATVDHFSLYALFNRLLWEQIWLGAPVCEPGDDGGGGGPGDVAVDVALVIDSSGSMLTNDPTGLRKTAAKNFVDALGDADEASVIDFDSSARIYSELTNDKDQLRDAIDLINSSGGTNIGLGVAAGLATLDRGPTDTDDAEFLVLLTDGIGSYSFIYTQLAIADDVIVFTIGLGNNVDTSLLESIADATGGRYFPAASADDLLTIFDEIGDETGGARDTDGDGLSDCEEINGWLDGNGILFTSDPDEPDTDGDLLWDGDEAGELIAFGPIPNSEARTFRRTPANPRALNSDARANGQPNPDDPIFTDADELNEGTDPRRLDTDDDGIDDYAEVFQGLDPRSDDTDDDGYDDLDELKTYPEEDPNGAIGAGVDPRVYNDYRTFGEFTRLYWKGFGCGDFLDKCAGIASQRDTETTPFLVGWIASAFAGPVTDVRDFVGSLVNADFLSAGINIVGLVPFGGDAFQALNRVRKFLDRQTTVNRVIVRVAKMVNDAPLPKGVRDDVFDLLTGGGRRILLANGVSDDAIKFLIRGGTDLKALGNAVEGAAEVRRGFFLFDWQDGERILRQADGFQATGKRLSVSDLPEVASNPLLRGRQARVIDAWNDGARIAQESKVGRQTLAGRNNDFSLLQQMELDAALKRNGRINEVEWHFFPSGSSDTIASDPAIYENLDRLGIPYIIHLP